ncbi:MAG: UvrD-helicase domain-containing protein [Bellilinea sp.]
MDQFAYTQAQEQVAAAPLTGSLFVSGPPGCGKTSTAVGRLRRMIDQGIPAESILILTPQRSLAAPNAREISRPDLPAGGLPTLVTLGGLAQRTLQLFWPAIVGSSGFRRPDLPPSYLTLETAQYYMAKVAAPLFERGYFEQLVIDRNRLYSQILDNLNKAAVVGFAHTDISRRLKAAWIGKPEQIIHYEQAQECAYLFRAYCLEHNLLDYSLQIELFAQQLWPSHLVRQYLSNQYRHLIYDNLEEDVPVVHDIVREWLPAFDSSLLIFDQGAGYRAFLGADPANGERLRESCDQTVEFSQSFVTQPALQELGSAFSNILLSKAEKTVTPQALTAYSFAPSRFYPEMIDWVAAEVARLVHEEQVPPGEIAIVSPFLSDSLRHSLMHRLQGHGVQARSHRPSRSLRDEPAARCLLTLARLAHPLWNLSANTQDVRAALLQTIGGIDLVRADLISSMLFSQRNKQAPLNSFDLVKPEMQERITFSIGERFMRLRTWLTDYLESEPVELDVFLARLFGELLAQPGFGFHDNFEAAGVTAHLIESVQKFRRVTEATSQATGRPIGQEYLMMVADGVIAAQYLPPSDEPLPDAVLIAPAYSFLMINQPVRFQFWLDVGSLGWWERLYQPLTHPHVLSRRWQPDKAWTDVDDFSANQETLQRLTSGLIARCREHIYLCAARVNERGTEEKGPLLYGIQSLLRLARELEAGHV